VRNQKAWVAKIAWRMALDHAKRRTRPRINVESSLDQLRVAGIEIDERMAEEQQVQLLRAMIATLPCDLREPLVLSTVDEMSNSDIAEVLGIPEASVRTRMARARTMLKQKVEALSKGGLG
jgi:RNA polymerase sigma-70 factor (ECF subfamily)